MELLRRDVHDFLYPHLSDAYAVPSINPELQGFVYIISPQGYDVVKIGHATHVSPRLQSLQVGCWATLVAEAAVGVYNELPEKLELAAHIHAEKKFKRLNGEWFEAKPQEALEVVLEAADELGILVKSVAQGFRDCEAQHKQSATEAFLQAEEARRAILRRKLGID